MANQRSEESGILIPLARLAGALAGLVRAIMSPPDHPITVSEPAELRHADVLYEHSDVNSRGVLITGVCILFGMWIIVSLLYFYYDFLSGQRTEAHVRPLPPEPRLQQSPARDLKELRLQEDGLLENYTWVDKPKGIVGIPIKRAIELTAQRGIPPQKAPANLQLFEPRAGTRLTGFEGQVEPESR